MGFKSARQQAVACLASGDVRHEIRGDIDVKNLLQTGEVSCEHVTAILKTANGREYTCSPHHFEQAIDVHTVTTTYQGEAWHIKWYFEAPDAIFISVHQ